MGNIDKFDAPCSLCKIIELKTELELLGLDEIAGHTIFGYDLIGPLTEKWMCVPHKCKFSNLVQIQYSYLMSWLSEQCYDEWMSINGGEYQLGKAGKLNYLWNERLNDFDTITFDKQKECMNDDLDNKLFSLNVCVKHKGIKHVQLRSNVMNKNVLNNRNNFKVLNKLFPFYDKTDKMHSNIDVTSLVINCLKYDKFKGVNAVLSLCPIGMANPTVVFLLIQWIGNCDCGKIWELMALDNACCMSGKSYKTYFKAISIAIRRTSLWYDGTPASLKEITACASWELALGRHSMISDWEEEKHNRLVDYLPLGMPLEREKNNETNEAYLTEAKIVLDEIMDQLVPVDFEWPDWIKFCEDRHSWLTSGSAGAKYLDTKYGKTRMNKRTYMETIPIKDMVAWLDEEPKIMAIASEKYEMGKARAIYGTDVKDQAIMSYLLTVLEPRLFTIDNIECGLTGASEVLSIIRRMNVAGRKGEECTMLDYSDFNRQHTIVIQSLIFRALKDKLIKCNAKDDAIRCAEWCELALLNQWVKFPGDIEFAKSVQGMFSGLRGTNFINTILNKVYYEVGKRWISENLKIKPKEEFVLHHGDDVWLSNKDRLWAITLYKCLQRCGLIFSDKKQIQDKNVAEFLRVVYTHEGARGYMARSIATLIERPLQSELEISPTMKATGVNSQILTCFRRGLDLEMCDILWDAIIPFTLKSSIEGVSQISVPCHAVMRSFPENGLDLGKPSTIAIKSGTIPKIPVLKFESKMMEEIVPQHTSNAYIKVMSEQIKEQFNSESVKKVIHATNISDSIPQKDKVNNLIIFHKQIKQWKEKLNKAKVPVGRRVRVEMDEWAEDVNIDFKLVDQIEQLCKEWEVNKLVSKQMGAMEIIFQCIASSPYKDIATAQRALDLSVIEAANICIHSSKDKQKIGVALKHLREIENCTSKEVLSRILSSVRGYGPSMEAFFNPVPLSYVTNYAVDKAVNYATTYNIKKLEKWDKILEEILKNSLKTAINQGSLIKISHY